MTWQLRIQNPEFDLGPPIPLIMHMDQTSREYSGIVESTIKKDNY